MPSKATIEWCGNLLNPSQFFRPMTLFVRSFIWAWQRFPRNGHAGAWLGTCIRSVYDLFWGQIRGLGRLFGAMPRTPEFIRWKIPVKYEKQRTFSAALHRISCSCVGALPSVALFGCVFSIGTFFGIIRGYTVLFSDPNKRFFEYYRL